jgi:hypothetical protein
MSDFSGGTVTAVYRIDTSQAERAAAQIRQLYQGIQASAPRGSAPRASTIDARQIAAHEAQQARLARQLGDTARAAQLESSAVQRLSAVLASSTTTTGQAAAAQRQLTAVYQQQARAAQQSVREQFAAFKQAEQGARGFGSALGGLGGAAGALGLVVVAEKIARYGNEAREASLSLQRTEALTREIAGSQAKYNEILSAARQHQSLFGGTLRDNIDQLSGFAVQARLSGANLQELINVAQRLATLDPGQGIAGASIALREALSGDVTSLSRRFEIPRVELAKLRDESTSTAERLRIISDFLTKAGISADVASRTTSDATRAYNNLDAALDSTKTKVGALIAELGKRPANFLANAIQALIISTPGEIARKLDEVRVNVVATSQSYDDYVGNLKRVNEQLRGVTDPIAGISRAQFDYAKSLQASGVGAEEAAAKAERYATVVEVAKQASGDWLGTNTALRDRLVALADTTDGNAAAVQNLAANINNIGVDRFLQAIALLEDQQRRATLATQEEEREQRRLSGAWLDGTPALDKHNQALAENINKAAGAKLEAQQLEAFQRSLAAIGDAVRLGHISAADGAAFLAKQYRITKGEAQDLLRLQSQVASISLDINSGTPQAGGDALNRFLTTGQRANQFVVTQAAAAEQARQQQLLSIGTDKQKIAVLQQQYDAAVRLQGVNSAAAINAQTALKQEQERQKEAAAKGGRTRVDQAARTALSLNQIEERSGLDQEKILRENQQRLLDAQEDFDVRRTRSKEDQERKIRRLLAQGQIAEAQRAREEFARDQQREQEDFARNRRRTLRDNRERTGDLDARTDLRLDQTQERARLRGVGVGGGPSRALAPGIAPDVPIPARGGGSGEVNLRIQIQPFSVQVGDKAVVDVLWPEIEQRVDLSLADEFGQLNVVVTPGSGQSAVAGARP